jgi:hypothetical protein
MGEAVFLKCLRMAKPDCGYPVLILVSPHPQYGFVIRRFYYIVPGALKKGSSPTPKRKQSVGTFAFTDEQNGAALQVQHNGQIAMPLADRDFVDRDLPNVFQRWSRKVFLQIRCL